jgi:hypothetical protein
MTVSPRRRQEIIDALSRGTVPHSSLDAFAVGLEAFEPALEQELLAVKGGGAVFKAVRGEYGCGNTFFARWLADRARKLGFATSEVQVSETETPLHRLETVYRRLCERLATADTPRGACGTSSTAGSTRWRRTPWRRAGRPRPASGSCWPARRSCWSSGWRR